MSESYQNLDFGTKPTTVQSETVEIVVDPNFMIGPWADSYAKELRRKNPGRFEAAGLSAEKLSDYFRNIVIIRVASLTGDFPKMRQCRMLFIPSWIEFVISAIGVVYDNDYGLKFLPITEENAATIDMAEMLGISDALQSFTSDGVVMHRDAFPRSDIGDKEVMSMAIVDEFVRSREKYSHPVASYVAAFLGFKLKKEAELSMLYRVTYDDVNFIKDMILREASIR